MWITLKKEWKGKPTGETLQVADESGELLLEGNWAEKALDPTGGVADGLLQKAADRMSEAFSSAITKALEKIAVQKVPAGEPLNGDMPGMHRKSFGDWLGHVGLRDNEYLSKTYPTTFGRTVNGVFQKASLNTQGGAQGGYLVPTEFYPQIMQIASEKSIVRRKATIIPMASRSIQIPTLNVTAAPASGDSAYFGGLVARWTEEAVVRTQTEPTFKQLEIVAHELSGFTEASNTLLQDNAISLEALLLRLFGEAVAWHEDHAFIRGNGVGKPLGVTEAAAAVSSARNTANDFKLVDAAKMLAKLLPGWGPDRTCWMMSPSVLEKLIQMADSQNVVWIPNARDPLPMQLFGLPIAVTEKLPALGTAKDVVLADFQHYLIGDRMQLEIAASSDFKFTNNQTVWRFVHRVDGQPWIRDKITLSDASSTVSPFVFLAA